eukprot:4833213-Pyramimonas_sp.AAC.1
MGVGCFAIRSINAFDGVMAVGCFAIRSINDADGAMAVGTSASLSRLLSTRLQPDSVAPRDNQSHRKCRGTKNVKRATAELCTTRSLAVARVYFFRKA